MDVFTGGRGFDCCHHHGCGRTTEAIPSKWRRLSLRQKGVKSVVVGAVPMNIPREPHFYKKELELKISCSIRPGTLRSSLRRRRTRLPLRSRPVGPRTGTWLRSSISLGSGSVDVKPLITHVFDIEQAEKAYDIVTGKIRSRRSASC
ncbi:MAG: hypothetical protein M0C28_27575 [Candidatus Moduliflexus flocculans]|nr:hypothetical protein [Candidatus Moduliflexus flocculans]